jgi:WASH complex subunit CCDC53
MLELEKEDSAALIGSGVDLTRVDPIHQRRLLAFVNHFTGQTVHFLNALAVSAESKLTAIDEQIDRIESSLTLFEARLESVNRNA